MYKNNKVLAIGPLSDIKRNRFSGQSIMFDGTVNALKRSGKSVYIVNIFPTKENATAFRRMLDYIKILLSLLWKSFQTIGGIAYITSSLGKSGIYRDIAFLTILRLSHHNVYLHQFGADISGIDSLHPSFKKMFTKSMGYVKQIIIEGDYIEKLFAEVPEVQGKLVKIPNGLPKEGAHANCPKSYKSGDPFRLFYLSNLIYSKGWYDVLQAVNILISEGRNVECIFAGRFIYSSDDDNTVDYKQLFYDYIENNNLGDVVKYYTGLYGDEKDRTFSESNVFLLPSYYINEGQPVSILEAMSYGCVPIVTNYRHIPMMVTEDNGCYVRPQCPRDIVASVCDLMDNPVTYEYKSKRCIHDYQTSFTYDMYVNKVISVIESE